MGRFVTWSARWARRPERAASLVEYALLLALIALVCVSATMYVGNTANDSLNDSGSSVFIP